MLSDTVYASNTQMDRQTDGWMLPNVLSPLRHGQQKILTAVELPVKK